MSAPHTLVLIRSYLVNLPAHEKESIMSELQAHLEDKAAALRAQGHPNADAAARSAFGNPQNIGARLADIHSRPTRGQLAFAILPFVLSGIVLPILLATIAAADRALGVAPLVMRIMGMEMNHTLTVALFFGVFMVIYGAFALGALYALQRGLPLWSAAWAGSALLCAFGFLQMLFDEADATTTLIGGLAFLLACAAGLVIVAHRRTAFMAVLIALCFSVQCGIIAAYILSAPPLSESVTGITLVVTLTLAASLALIAALQRWPGYQALLALAGVLSIAPYTLRLMWQGNALGLQGNLAANVVLPGLLLLALPYLSGRRSPTRGAWLAAEETALSTRSMLVLFAIVVALNVVDWVLGMLIVHHVWPGWTYMIANMPFGAIYLWTEAQWTGMHYEILGMAADDVGGVQAAAFFLQALLYFAVWRWRDSRRLQTPTCPANRLSLVAVVGALGGVLFLAHAVGLTAVMAIGGRPDGAGIPLGEAVSGSLALALVFAVLWLLTGMTALLVFGRESPLLGSPDGQPQSAQG
jgi:hypothetical protein